MDSLHVVLAVPERVVWSGGARFVAVRTPAGDLGVLPGHAPLVALTVPGGALTVRPVEGPELRWETGEGVLHLDRDGLRVLADTITERKAGGPDRGADPSADRSAGSGAGRSTGDG
ncbi:F0F1 ATP synthase subunit epsilon [Streptomyces sp. NPDC097619]|uniref:F0F1 ATP synthase subunit epsilon n=1 Tax=Streptomyces sp. NPDC097619 TaxID=3157228 RepID=UPI00332E2C58